MRMQLGDWLRRKWSKPLEWDRRKNVMQANRNTAACKNKNKKKSNQPYQKLKGGTKENGKGWLGIYCSGSPRNLSAFTVHDCKS
jgi:hypothetical protein